MKQDITKDLNNELSYQVFNAPRLYDLRADADTLIQALDDTFEYTNDQLVWLISDLQAEDPGVA